jgi:DNA repair exonuclease SbcCD ATPase subunit
MTEKNMKQWRLQSVTISNFRGIKKERTFAFDGLSALLHGKNGVGKSTIALVIQWTLYGKFPDGVLMNSSFDSFLTSVTAKQKKSYSGEVKFIRGDEKLSVFRGADKKSFAITYNSELYEGDDAEKRLGELLVLDMDTFTRSVLLQQTKIRGLLMAEPKERNKALDRLLGMDRAGTLLEHLKSTKFRTAAKDWLSKTESKNNDFNTKEETFNEDLEESKTVARNLKFSSEDFYPEGLKNAFSELSEKIKALGKKSNITLDELTECSSIEMADAVDRQITEMIRKIRDEADNSKQLQKAENSIGLLNSHKDSWTDCTDYLKEAEENLKQYISEKGDLPSLKEKRKTLNAEQIRIADQLKTTDTLRQLLVDARGFIATEKPEKCPVCQQNLPENLDLPSDLEKRINEMITKSVDELEESQNKTRISLKTTDKTIEACSELTGNLEKAQQELIGCYKKITDQCDNMKIAKDKISAQFEIEIDNLVNQKEKLKDGVIALYGELDALDGRRDDIKSGLVPLLRIRKKIFKLQEGREKLKEDHKGETEKSEKMEILASQIESIKSALIEAKDDMATDWLKQAKPRSLELYKTLVNHPLFDTLNITTKRSKAKVDYDFRVGVEGNSQSARDARLVLSDGQLTATAMALLFSLAETTNHGLDLLYIDDPTQNLDSAHKEEMAKVINEISKRKQVIISTQDEDFVAGLRLNGFNDSAIIHHIKKWDGNPTVESTLPY